MNNLEWLLIGVFLGAVPSAEVGRVALVAAAKKVGVRPKEIERYNAATEDD